MKIIAAIEKFLAYIERSIIVFLLGVMILLAFSQVILRNCFSTGFLWADTLLRHMVLWIGFIGASIAAHEEKHINLDIVSRFASPRVTHVIRIITNLFPSIVCLFLAHAGWVFLLSEKESETELFAIGATSFATWWFEIIIPVGFALLATRFLLKAIEHSIFALAPPAKNEPAAAAPSSEA
jgi:TRAP-type C4-dicarboxylate transport system permease small subunit